MKSVYIEKNKKSMNNTKKNMDKFLLTEQNRIKMDKMEQEKIEEMNKKREEKEKTYNKNLSI